MKKLLWVFPLLALIGALFYPHDRADSFQLIGTNSSSSSSSSSGAAFSEDWDCTNADSPDCDLNWTEDLGDADITSNQLVLVTGGWEPLWVISQSAINTANGYAKFTFVGTYGGSRYPHLVFRYTNSSSAHYTLEFIGNDPCRWSWYRYPTAGGSSSEIANTELSSCSNGDTYAVTWTGTGASTAIRIWKNQTANTPVSATEWDSGDNTPDGSFTADPATPVDTGTLVGFAAYSASGSDTTIDNLYYGDLP